MAIKTQYETAKVYQDYENLVIVASQIFGKSSSTDKGKEVETFDELEAFINGL